MKVVVNSGWTKYAFWVISDVLIRYITTVVKWFIHGSIEVSKKTACKLGIFRKLEIRAQNGCRCRQAAVITSGLTAMKKKTTLIQFWNGEKNI